MAGVLLVEDDAEDVEITERTFRKGRIRNPLHVVRSGEATLQFLRHTGCYADVNEAPRPALVVLDLHLAGLDGCEVLRQIKGDPRLRRIPVVVPTTSSEEADVARCYDGGLIRTSPSRWSVTGSLRQCSPWGSTGFWWPRSPRTPDAAQA